MILVTGANGQTGRAIIKALLSKGKNVRAFVYSEKDRDAINEVGEMEIAIGDMMDQEAVNEAFIGVKAVYHICSALNPNEVEIGQIAIEAAKAAGVEQFVFHSVLHSVLQEMPHHQKKLKVEELLVDSGLPYTIIQPAVFMQNIYESWDVLKDQGIFRQKFFTNEDTRMCLLDLADLAEAMTVILGNQDYIGATYELCGPENLSLQDMVSTMEECFERTITVETTGDEQLSAMLRNFGADEYRVTTLLKMFHHYNEHGFVGNDNVATWVLGRRPNDFKSFLQRSIKEK